ncbi:MAG: CARDB domain-containing protein [Vicinamibacterales bacterium]
MVALSAMIMPARPAGAQRAPRFERENISGRQAVAREVLVKFRDPLQPQELDDLATQTVAQSVERVGSTGTLRIRSRSQNAAALVQALSRHPDVAYAEPNWIIQIASTPDDTWFSELWGLDRIGAIPAWNLTTGSVSTVVGVIDTGLDYTHPDLSANVWSAPTPFSVTVGGHVIHCGAGTHGFNAITRQCNPMDDQNHGTHVSGTIGAVGNNGTGVAGVNWTTQLMGIKFLDHEGTGTTADAIAAVEFAIAVKQAFQATDGARVRILSASWGGPDFSQALLDQVKAANDTDMLFVAAAGNNGTDNDSLPLYPASFDAPNIVTVAATAFGDNLTGFSNYGASSVHLAAPGEFILSTTIGNGYGYSSGTSMAVPHVSGAAALLLSQCVLDTATLKDTLLGTVDYLPGLTGATATGGRLNVNSALLGCTAVPAVPSVLEARGMNMSVVLEWSSVPGAMRYNVKRSLTPGGPYMLLASDVRAITFTDTAVVNGTTYYYVISAENTLGESGDSTESSAVPDLPPDLIVSALTTPTVGGAGSTIPVSVSTSNAGTGTAKSSVTHIYLSVNSTFDASDTLLAAVSVPQLSPGTAAPGSPSLVIPERTNVGTYYLIGLADADDELDESNESNNRLSRSIRIGPDLAIDAVAAPPSGAAGAMIAVTDSTHNKGGGAAAATVTTFYLSANVTISADDILLGSRTVPAVAASGTSTGTTTWTIPGTTAAGVYYIVAKADASDQVAETTENNNAYPRAIQIGGDLVISRLTVPATGGAGLPLSASDTTRNQGTESVGPSVTKFYFSANASFDATDTLLGNRAVPDLAPEAENSSATTLIIPSNVATGTYYVIARADADAGIAETNDSNNSLARSVKVGSDLVINTSLTTVKTAAGAILNFSETVTNQGGGPATPSVTRYYLSTDATLSTTDVLLDGGRDVSGLPAGDSSTGSTSVLIPAGVAPGVSYIIGKADADSTVNETSEINNTKSRAISIGPDLIVSAISAPSSAVAGTSINVTDTVMNQGADGAAPTLTRFYLSTNVLLESTDIALGQGRAVPSVAAGALNPGTTAVTIPSSVGGGGYYLLVKADGDHAVGESYETNNVKARAIQVTTAP